MSYRSYSYAELMLIPNLCLIKTPVGVTELILIQNLYLTDLFSIRTPVGVIELILILRSLHMFGSTRRYHRDYGRILILQNLSLYESTCKYYKTYTGTSYLTCTTKYILVLRNLY